MNRFTPEDYLPFFNWSAASISMLDSMMHLDYDEGWLWGE
jgi:hypothetical protein